MKNSKYIVTTLLGAFLISKVALANSIILNAVYDELTTYKNSYKIESVVTIEYNGLVNKKYLTDVTYLKKFCDDKGEKCEVYKCETPAIVDSHLVVDFESETKVENCKKQKSADEIKMCVDACLATNDTPGASFKACVSKCQ